MNANRMSWFLRFFSLSFTPTFYAPKFSGVSVSHDSDFPTSRQRNTLLENQRVIYNYSRNSQFG